MPSLSHRAGVFVCRFEQAQLLPGQYTINVYCTAGGAVADWVTDAAVIDVDEGDYYGTGRLPPPGYGSVAMEYKWALEST
jgi:lipopolysaccharide transport system ATP-binding protein